jgi:16S rRNA (cytidine1402-2'-O)-methyltransferase
MKTPAKAPVKILTLVATPLGNPEDLSFRAKRVLESADLILCEDTRKARELFERAKIQTKAKLVALPGDREDHFDFERHLAPVQNVALISDAGTPIVNDPGHAVLDWVRKASRAAEWQVQAVPGPSAPILALQWSGGFGLPFVFLGFVPKARAHSKEIQSFFEGLLHTSGSCIFFDTKHQFPETMQFLQKKFPDRKIAIAREMTKAHEELFLGTLREAALWVESKDFSKAVGELTVILESKKEVVALVPLEELAKIRHGSAKESAKIAAKFSGLSVRECYKALMGEKQSLGDSDESEI